jgi:hypothetical protein
MIIPQATIEGFTANPPPADWTEHKPGTFAGSGAGSGEPAKPIVNRFERAYGSSSPTATADGAPPPIMLQAPPRTLGSKIPINRRHKRRR